MKTRIFLFLTLFFSLGFSGGFLASDFIKDKAEKLGNFYIPPKIQAITIKKDVKTIETFQDLKEDLVVQKIPVFLEINFPDMKARMYEGGELKKEVDISARGDSEEWGGTAAGLYKIIYKNKLAFSGIASVNMPFAMNFYGKFFVHGVPYYDNGSKRITDVTGGCVQLSDSDAEEIFKMTENNTPVIVVDRYNDNYDGYEKKENITHFPLISATSYLVADLDSGSILAQKAADEKHPIASLTKLMTAVVISENIDLRKSISVTADMLEAFGSTNGLVAGKKFNVVDLFYPLLIESSNDAAEVLSSFLGREKTLKLMNEKAKSLGMENTAYVDPHGFDPANISTPTDLFYLSRYILNNRTPLFNITKGEDVSSYGEKTFKDLENKNLFFDEEGFIGGKTGYIKASKYNGVFLMKFSNSKIERRIAIIMLGSENLLYGEKSLKTDVQKTAGWINENYFSEDLIVN